jgi:nitroreductase
MDALQAVMTRRSIRKYTGQPVSDELVTRLLRAAMAAPSAGNQQPWHFVVIRDRTSLEAIASAHPYGKMAREAQLAVLVCGDESLGDHPGFWVQDCAAATENLLIAAHALGLGAVWLGTYPREDRVAHVRALCAIPDHLMPFAIVPIGYPAEHPAPADRFEEVRVHTERWQEQQ